MSTIDNSKLRSLIVQEVSRRYSGNDNKVSKKRLHKIITEEVRLALLTNNNLNKTHVVCVLPEINRAED
jgi:hypothetical protein